MAKNGLGRSLYAAYVVIRGRTPGVYDTWKDCKPNVDKFPGASFKGFVSRVEAENAFQDAQREGFISSRGDLAKSTNPWRDQSITQKGKYYVVFVGIRPGIYDNWSDCRLNSAGCSGARYKSFKSKGEAERAFADAKAKNEVLEKARKPDSSCSEHDTQRR
ncbi:uncharacterized protein LAESUDRAFT_721051 [Laetiporus sulphureus 93-53]|uniref:Ribonuclease H n=1 Tax=Laetiporus sulphureus 93-53 TaxID=1314785 RepID=A0A165GR25_9APHY|nr:uncharacterized protein LAESUDRAFT_721051 [Laetiporus sulphureus 93-53]KZT10688.1 hypothetical protein LAESUDRAFT_721051 [Laetiporus sulphureus 93-53]